MYPFNGKAKVYLLHSIFSAIFVTSFLKGYGVDDE